MLRAAALLAGLGAALITAGSLSAGARDPPTAVSGCQEGPDPWKVQCVANDIVPGNPYRAEGCLVVSGAGADYVALRLVWYSQADGFGPSLGQSDLPADLYSTREQCLSFTAAAPCAARSARYGVVVKGDAGAVSVDSASLGLAPDPAGTLVACPAPTPAAASTSTATSTPRATATPSPAPTRAPTPSPTTGSGDLSQPTREPAVFPSLVNGGFEQVRDDGTPYGWRKVGGEMSATNAVHAEGQRSAALVSRTESTKWLYQTVSVQGGSFYRLQAKALKNHSGVREVLLRISWYSSGDGSGSQLSTSDSEALGADSPRFVALDTGPVQAPPQARSAKVRLLLRPASAASAVVYFDAVSFDKAVAAALSLASGEERAPQPEGTGDAAEGRRGRRAPAAEPVAPSTWAGPTALANERLASQPQADVGAGGGRPFWPLVLAFGVPAAGLAAMAAHAWRAARLAGRNGPHL